MKKLFTLTAIAALLATITGCTGPNSQISPALVQQGVLTGVQYSVAKYPQAVPYLRVAGDIVCSMAAGENLSPTNVVAVIEASPLAAKLKTPEGTLILNGALTLYIGVWDSLVGTNAAPDISAAVPYLQATCAGIGGGLPPLTMQSKRAVPAARVDWPLIRFP